jgi:glycosyltransferase involved in cell wall biosynthesis
MKKPLISIVMCTWNGEQYLQEQLLSILHQDYPAWELIISDDASTDGTLKMLEQYAGDNRIKIFKQLTNLGPVKNFEFVLQKATGDFICFADQDDIWLPNKISSLYNAIGNAALVYSDSLLVDEKGVSLNKQLSTLRNLDIPNNTKGFVFNNIVWGHASMISNFFLTHVLPIPNNTPHDIWMGFKATALKSIAYTPQVLTHYRQHNNTHTKTLSKEATARKKEVRQKDFQEKLVWIRLMKQHTNKQEYHFYMQLEQLYASKQNKGWNYKLFLFLLKNKHTLFSFSRKKTSSIIIEIIKQARSEAQY